MLIKTLLTIILTSQVCSSSLERRVIYGNVISTPFQYKFLVSIQVSGAHSFSGTLVDKKTVLTVASKLEHPAEAYKVHFHRHDLSRTVEEERGEVYSVSQMHKFPTFNSTNFLDDLALLKLSDSVIGDIGKVVVDDGSYFKNDNVGLGVLVVGWGATQIYTPNSNRLHQAKLTIESQKVCNGHHERLDRKLIGPNIFCAVNDQGSSVCDGDSGGPLFHQKEGRYFIVGITTNTEPCDRGIPPVFTKVNRYLKFIHKFMEKDQQKDGL